MKNFIIVAVLLCLCGYSLAELQCTHKKPNMTDAWITMASSCTKKMRDQVQEELKASIQYLAMGAHFSKDTVNRPGAAKLFFEAASEEREHAIKLISYLLMRGELTDQVSSLIKTNIVPVKRTWTTLVEALNDALQLEATVTKLIRLVIKTCEDEPSFNDYHLVDYLTGDFLTEQYNGQRELAGRISTLGKMMEQHGALGEFLYDKKILAE